MYEINQRLKLWARVAIAVSSCPAAAHMCLVQPLAPGKIQW